MSPDKLYKLQGYFFGLAALAAGLGLSAKDGLSSNRIDSQYIEFIYFFRNFTIAPISAYIYWICCILFGCCFIFIIIFEKSKK